MIDLSPYAGVLLPNLPSYRWTFSIPTFHMFKHFNLTEAMFCFRFCGIAPE